MYRNKSWLFLGSIIAPLVIFSAGISSTLAESVIPDGWVYELLADVDGIQDPTNPEYSGFSSSRCPVGAYWATVDSHGNVYFATSSCNVGSYWVIRVQPDGSWARFGDRQVPDLDGVFAETTASDEIFLYASGDGGISKFDEAGMLVRRYGGVSGNGQGVAVNASSEIFASTISRGILKIDPTSGAVSTFFNEGLDNSVVAVDEFDNVLVRRYNRFNNLSDIYQVDPQGNATLILSLGEATGAIAAQPGGDIFMRGQGGSILRVYQDMNGSWQFETFASGVGAHGLSWNTDGTVLYVSTGADRKIYTLSLNAITATVNLDPNVLNVKSKGNFLTCYIELPDGYAVEDILIDSILLNESLPAKTSPTEIGDQDLDGIPDLMVKFDRQEVYDLLPVGEYVEFHITGNLSDGTLFEGTDLIWVLDQGVEHLNEDDPSAIAN